MGHSSRQPANVRCVQCREVLLTGSSCSPSAASKPLARRLRKAAFWLLPRRLRAKRRRRIFCTNIPIFPQRIIAGPGAWGRIIVSVTMGSRAAQRVSQILQAIDGQQLDNIVVVVTRWFGGILLGSGGLMRAYGGTAASCLRQAEKTEVIALVGFALACDFSDHALLKARLTAVKNVAILQENFTATGVEMTGAMPIAAKDDLSRLVSDLTRGKTIITFDE
ncbi:conserved hypothetical protein [Brucella pinnipedialis M163/99/10]|nr:conserved hypothetical protein [Brucella pinnipedialis M163/99/10]